MFDDLQDGFFMWRIWTTFGYEDLRNVYRRTALGLAWIALSFGLFALVKVLIFSTLTSDSDLANFATWVIVGFLVWQFIQNVVISGSSVFISSEGWIKGVPLPISVHVYKVLWRIHIQSAVNMATALLLIAIFGRFDLLGLALSLLAIPVYIFAAVPVQIGLGLLCVISRDIQKFIETVIRLAFFVTPIIWEPTSGTVRETVAFYNPFTYVIALFRTPIIEGRYDFNALIVVLAITFVLWVFALVAMRVLRAQLPYRL